MRIKCCYKCEERKIGCHSVCEKYISERRAVALVSEERVKKSNNRVIYSKTRRNKGKTK